MTQTRKSGPPHWRRRQFVIDRSVQMGVAGHLLVGLGGVALLCAAALYVFFSGAAVPGLDPLRRFLLLANATYFVLTAGILVLLTLLLTHRFAGPAFVMRRAIRGMLNGDYSYRLTLREKDYLKELANDLSEFRDVVSNRETATRKALADARQALDAGDGGPLAELVAAIEATLPAPEPDEAPAEAPADALPEPEHVPEPTLVG